MNNTATPTHKIHKGALVDLETRVIITAAGRPDHAPNMIALSYVKLNDPKRREHTNLFDPTLTVAWVNPNAVTRRDLLRVTRIVETRPSLSASLAGHGQAQPIAEGPGNKPTALRPKQRPRYVSKLQAA